MEMLGKVVTNITEDRLEANDDDSNGYTIDNGSYTFNLWQEN
jgi:hypothetical protein